MVIPLGDRFDQTVYLMDQEDGKLDRHASSARPCSCR